VLRPIDRLDAATQRIMVTKQSEDADISSYYILKTVWPMRPILIKRLLFRSQC
jgi:predicted component of type VI protein secretion system